jgi:methylated-DNA-protein-cysteine methyltransferase-like protein
LSERHTFEDRVIAVLRALGPGDVVTYGEVAAEAGAPGAARAVGNLLRRGLPDVPWWRVVRADGSLSCPARAEQIARLRAEGVPVENGRIT